MLCPSLRLRRGLRAAAAASALFLSLEVAEGGDAFLASLRELEDVYVGTPKLFFETQPVHPGCANAINYALDVFGLPSDALDITSMIGTALSLCVPVNSVTRSIVDPNSESTDVAVDYDFLDWTPEELDFVQEVARQVTEIWQEVVKEVEEESKPRDALGIMRHPYTNVERGLSALNKMFAKASESPEISLFLARLLPDLGMSSPSSRGIVALVRFCITNVPDVLVGLLSSKTVGNILVNLISRLELVDGAGFNMAILGNFREIDLGSVLCKGIDFSVDGKDFDPRWVVCGLANALGAIMSCTSTTLDCTTIAKTAETPPVIAPRCDKTKLNGEMPHPGALTNPPADVDMTLLPASDFYDANGEVNRTTVGNEGYVYFYDFRTTTFQAQFTSQSGCSVDRVLDQFIPGWNRTAEIFLNQPASSMHDELKKDYLAFATISRRGQTCDWHIAQRGTFNQFEWVKNFQAELRPIPYPGVEGAAWHRGYGDFVAVVAPMFDDYFSKFIGPGKECGYEESKIHLAGHSLGGGMVEAYSLHFASVWQPLGVTIESVAIAPARALNPAAMAFVADRVNMRSIVNHMDLVPRFPCDNAHGLPRCDPRKCFTFNGEGWDTTYATHPNQLNIELADMQALNATKFAHFDLNVDVSVAIANMAISLAIKEMPSHLDIATQHIDIYNCYFSRNFCTEDENVLESACL